MTVISVGMWQVSYNAFINGHPWQPPLTPTPAVCYYFWSTVLLDRQIEDGSVTLLTVYIELEVKLGILWFLKKCLLIIM